MSIHLTVGNQPKTNKQTTTTLQLAGKSPTSGRFWQKKNDAHRLESHPKDRTLGFPVDESKSELFQQIAAGKILMFAYQIRILSYGDGSKPYPPGEHQNSWSMDVHPTKNGMYRY